MVREKLVYHTSNMNTNAFEQYLAQQNAQLQTPQSPNQLQQVQPYQSQTSQIVGDPSVLRAYQQQMIGGEKPQQGIGSFGPPPQGMSQSQWNGMCEAWAEQQAFGRTGLFPSAIAAAQHFHQSGQLNPNINQAPAGSLIYFGADNSNGGYGHVAIADGQGNITGATYNGIQTHPLNAWTQSTGQTPLGFVAVGGK